MRCARVFFVLSATLALTACTGGPRPPAALDNRNETCGYCRMAVSNVQYAAQIVAPGVEPIFFDDIGCFQNYLHRHAAPPRQAVAYVADHLTREWILAASALYTLVPHLDTPMGSHLIAHKSAASRDADPTARAGNTLPMEQVFPLSPPDGYR